MEVYAFLSLMYMFDPLYVIFPIADILSYELRQVHGEYKFKLVFFLRNGTHNIATVTVFWSESTLWKQRLIRFHLMNKYTLAGLITILGVSSKYGKWRITVLLVNEKYG